MSWTFEPAAEAFEKLRTDWDALNRSQHNHVLLDSAFVAPLIRHFGDGKVLVGVSNDASAPGMVLVVKTAPGIWETFQPSQAPLGLILLGSRDPQMSAATEIIRSLPGLAVQLGVLQQDPDYSSFPATPPGPQVQILDAAETGGLEVTGSFEDFWESRNSDLKQNVSRRQRRLAGQGKKLTLLTHRSPDVVAECLRAYGRMESQGWKGREGSALSEDNAQTRFYSEVMESFCVRGEGYIYQLWLDDLLIGSEVYIARNGMLVGLKTTYDESYRNISPGFLMKFAIIRQVFEEKEFRDVEFYGRVKDWHKKWSTHFRTMYHINCFRHRWVNSAREVMKRFA
jgi:Acetyltransferase (GNAT) domain